MKAQLDHFEKWIGICKFCDSKSVANQSTYSQTRDRTEEEIASEKSGKRKLNEVEPAEQSCEKCNTENDCGSDDNHNVFIEGSKRFKLDSQFDAEDIKDTHIDFAEKKDDYCHHNETETEMRTVPSIQQEKPNMSKSKSLSNHPAEIISLSTRDWKARRVDLIVAPYSQYFYALVGWTGNKQFNRDLRTYAPRELNMHLSSHGLWDYAQVWKYMLDCV